MKFGLAFYSEPRKMAQLAELAEKAGWDGCYLGDAIWTMDPMISLATAGFVTQRIRLGTMVVPAPLRRPWKLASELLALDHLTNGRITLGLGAGAVWMGWQAFPDEITDTKARAEMLDETIDILTLLFQRKQFDYDGKYFHPKLTQMDVQYYPPKPIQQPRIPIWVPGIWPRMKSMRRILKCDGLLPQKMDAEGKFVDLLPDDLRQMKAFIDANRTLTTPFDIVFEGKTGGLEPAQAQEKIMPWVEAGATWWIEGLWGESDEQVIERIKKGPPGL